MFNNHFRSFLLFLAALHTLVMVISFYPDYAGMLSEGLVLTVGQDGMRGAAFWSLQFGLMLGVFGLQLQPEHLPNRSATALLTAICLLGVCVFPLSGFAILALACGPLWAHHWRT